MSTKTRDIYKSRQRIPEISDFVDWTPWHHTDSKGSSHCCMRSLIAHWWGALYVKRLTVVCCQSTSTTCKCPHSNSLMSTSDQTQPFTLQVVTVNVSNWICRHALSSEFLWIAKLWSQKGVHFVISPGNQLGSPGWHLGSQAAWLPGASIKTAGATKGIVDKAESHKDCPWNCQLSQFHSPNAHLQSPWVSQRQVASKLQASPTMSTWAAPTLIE